MHLQLQLTRTEFELNVDLNLPDAGVTAIFGVSGSGKTTLLRCVAGLEKTARGQIEIAGLTWLNSERKIKLPTWQRPIGYVFQEASLFEHLDVRGNLEYGLRRAASERGRTLLDQAIELLGIGALLARAPRTLSGGERQRVAIARALATGPSVLLFDEPLAALDPMRKSEVLPWIERLRHGLALPILYVTHTVDEVTRLADHLIILSAGRVASMGPLAAVLASDAQRFFPAQEQGVVIEGVIAARDPHWQLCQLELGAGLHIWVADQGAPTGSRIRVRVLARDVSLALRKLEGSSIQNQLPCRVEAMVADQHPSQMLVRLVAAEHVLLARVTRKSIEQLGIHIGLDAWLQVKSVAVMGNGSDAASRT